MYVIMRGEKYVSRFGAARSYTSNLVDAQLFASAAEARRHLCSNEELHLLPWRF